MAIVQAPTLLKQSYSGEAPLAVAHGSAVLANNVAGDKVRLSKVFAGTKVYAAKLITGALGAGVTVDFGYEYCNNDAPAVTNAFGTAFNAAAAGKEEYQGAPIVLPYDAYIVAIIDGGTANGEIDSVVTYEFQGQ